MIKFNSLIILMLISILSSNPLSADSPYYIDFKYILNESNAGKKAQDFLKSKLEKNIKSIKEKEKKKYKKRKKKLYNKKN
ncbi:hypothetical protein IDH05_01710 [Pelagibacterales bacterium SAG-MED27]|nr:hypothetical protein [Pelagibacterales bacterium SAG-MED27]